MVQTLEAEEQHKVNWARGLLRLWIVFAILWAALCLGYAVLNPPRTHVLEVLDQQSEKFEVEVPEGTTDEQLTAYAIGAARDKWNRAECAPDKRGPWCDFTTKLPPMKAVPWPALIAGILVPASLLIFGLSFYWAILGFRHR
jgi:preprotein translocase subunit SecG